LERERGERDRLRRQIADVDAALVSVRADQKRINQDVEAVQKAHLEIEDLRPKAAEQDKLENEASALREKLSTAKAARDHIKNIDEKLARLRENYKVNKEKLAEAEARAVVASALSTLEQREAVLTRDLAALQAGLERDEKFQSEIKNGLCPILSQKCLNLKEGETLEAFVSSQFTEIRTQISTIESEHVAVRTDLQAARQAAQFAAALEEYKQRGEELTEEGQRYSEEKAELSRQVNDLAELERLFAATESALKELADPRSRIRFLETELAREVDLRLALSEVEANLERLTQRPSDTG
jgi:DNA repair exonuclease SbcCD ATPase subunit